ncbi:Hypothetical protein HVR_LOCUS820 [uncultured virus]|nr:Hypothetical protein HVR_LOCUS820 [uncultured virus]
MQAQAKTGGRTVTSLQEKLAGLQPGFVLDVSKITPTGTGVTTIKKPTTSRSTKYSGATLAIVSADLEHYIMALNLLPGGSAQYAAEIQAFQNNLTLGKPKSPKSPNVALPTTMIPTTPGVAIPIIPTLPGIAANKSPIFAIPGVVPIVTPGITPIAQIPVATPKVALPTKVLTPFPGTIFQTVALNPAPVAHVAPVGPITIAPTTPVGAKILTLAVNPIPGAAPVAAPKEPKLLFPTTNFPTMNNEEFLNGNWTFGLDDDSDEEDDDEEDEE